MKNWTLILCLFLFPTLSSAQSTEQADLVFLGSSSLNLIGADDDAFLAFGVGAEAQLGYKFSIGGNVTFGQNEFSNATFVQPHARMYFAESFQGFFLEMGGTFGRLNARDDHPFVGPPFPLDRGASASYHTFDLGLGFSTLVKNRWFIGFSLVSCVPLSDIDLIFSLASDFSIGYAF